MCSLLMYVQTGAACSVIQYHQSWVGNEICQLSRTGPVDIAAITTDGCIALSRQPRSAQTQLLMTAGFLPQQPSS